MLEELSHDLIKFSYAATTLTNMHTHKKRYKDFCTIFNVKAFPVTQWQLVRYATFLSFYFTSPKSIDNYVASVCTINELTGYGKVVKGILYKKAMAGIRRKLKHIEIRAKPITFEMIHKILRQVNFHDDKQLASWTAVIYGFHLFLRKSNLVPDAPRIEDEKQFQRKDFRIHNNVMLVHIKWAKNRQFGGNEKLLIPIVSDIESDLCPFYWFNCMAKQIPALPNAAAFSYPREGKLIPLTYRDVQMQLRDWLTMAGYSGATFSMHGLRCGTTTTAFEVGVPGFSIKILGDWASSAYLRYIDITLDSRMKAWKLFSLKGKLAQRNISRGSKH